MSHESPESDLLIRDIRYTGHLIGALLAVLAWLFYDLQTALFLLLGILLATLNLRWLLAGVDRALGQPSQEATIYVLIRFFLRLALIIACLYVTIQASFRGTLAGVAGFSVYLLGALVVGVKLALIRPGKHSHFPYKNESRIQ